MENEKKINDIKIFNVRMPKKYLRYIKQQAFMREMSMNEFCLGLIEGHKKKYEKSLTKEKNGNINTTDI